ncbi:hypothetical protein GDO86_004899 [Hymenochirus boettgeri]|uniref:Uncharacterized protein n=1 Tax=Hymenochirus boettgeri TaxID=247094 RepID=A0A8T2J2I4_9PIPI|nr:hypothetical protein GDO86_004899 [Hymenochirus boettgeri]
MGFAHCKRQIGIYFTYIYFISFTSRGRGFNTFQVCWVFFSLNASDAFMCPMYSVCTWVRYCVSELCMDYSPRILYRNL